METKEIFINDTTMVITLTIIIGILVCWCVLPAVQSAVWEANNQYHFTGNISEGKPGQDGWPYGWLCYEKSSHNLEVNKRMGWAVNDRGICEWR